MDKEYLGDGVYVEEDRNNYSGCIKLTTGDGKQDTNWIYLEPNEINKLLGYISRMRHDEPEPDEPEKTENFAKRYAATNPDWPFDGGA